MYSKCTVEQAIKPCSNGLFMTSFLMCLFYIILLHTRSTMFYQMKTDQAFYYHIQFRTTRWNSPLQIKTILFQERYIIVQYETIDIYIVNKCLVKSSGDKIKHCTSGILARSSPIKHPGGSSSASPEIKSSNQAS